MEWELSQQPRFMTPSEGREAYRKERAAELGIDLDDILLTGRGEGDKNITGDNSDNYSEDNDSSPPVSLVRKKLQPVPKDGEVFKSSLFLRPNPRTVPAGGVAEEDIGQEQVPDTSSEGSREADIDILDDHEAETENAKALKADKVQGAARSVACVLRKSFRGSVEAVEEAPRHGDELQSPVMVAGRVLPNGEEDLQVEDESAFMVEEDTSRPLEQQQENPKVERLTR